MFFCFFFISWRLGTVFVQKLLITNLGSFVRGGAIQILFPFVPLGKLHLSRHLFLLNCCNPCLLFPMNSGNAAQSSCPADMKVLSPDPNLILPVLSQGHQPCANNQGLSSSPPYPRLLALQPSGQFNQPQTHHFVANRWGDMLLVADFIFIGSKITVDSDCSHDIKRCFLLGKKKL